MATHATCNVSTATASLLQVGYFWSAEIVAPLLMANFSRLVAFTPPVNFL
jgi:hypothetical protein